MKELCEYLVRNIAKNPDAVKVELNEEENAIVLHVILNEEDMGRVIGKEGKTANAIRTIIRAMSDTSKRVIVKFN